MRLQKPYEPDATEVWCRVRRAPASALPDGTGAPPATAREVGTRAQNLNLAETTLHAVMIDVLTGVTHGETDYGMSRAAPDIRSGCG